MATKGINPILSAKADLAQELKDMANNHIDGVEIVNAGNKNTAPIAARFLIAEQARSFWNKQYDVVKKEAKDAGILGDEADYIEGETVVVSSFSGFDICAKKAAASEMVDKTALLNALNKHVPAAKRQAIIAECVKQRKGAVTISVSVK